MSPANTSPTVTVITPLYNSSQHIEATLNSLCRQTYGNWACILIDDGSTDDTPQKVEPFLRDSRFTYVKQKNQGIAGARNTGLKAATGEWVCLLDHDDRWHETKLEKQLEFARRHACDIVCTDAAVIQGDTQTLYSSLYPADFIAEVVRSATDPSVDVCGLLIRQDFLCASSVMIRKSLFDRFGLLDEFAAPADDYEMWLRCAPVAKIGYLKEPLIEYVLHQHNYSHNKIKMAEKVIYVLGKIKTEHAGDERRSSQIEKSRKHAYHYLFVLYQMERQYTAALSQSLHLMAKGQAAMPLLLTTEWVKRWVAGVLRRGKLAYRQAAELH